MKVNRWVQCALAGLLLCWTAVGMAVAPVEDALPDGSAAVSDADDMTTSDHVGGEAHHELAPEPTSGDDSDHRTRWEDTSDDADFQPPAPAHTNTQSNNNASSLAQLTQQVNNMAAMNVPARLDELQHSIAQLRGQLQVQQHALKQLEAKLAGASKGGALHTSPKLKPLHTVKPAGVKHVAATVAQKNTAESSQEAYTNAFDALMNKQYGTAKTGFQAYLANFPQGAYVSNATYWLAEIALVKRQYKEAEKRLGVVINQFPNSSKYPDARYKLAMTHLRMHQTQLAKEELQALSHDFSGKTVGRLADIALEQLDLD